MTVTTNQAGITYLPTTGHFYEYVSDPGVSWSAAESAATSTVFDGQPGYLATIPSATVNSFIVAHINGAQNVWAGGRSVDYPSGYLGNAGIQRVWTWQGGPLAGSIFSECSNISSGCSFVNDGGLYHDWNAGEPNNSGYPSSGDPGEHQLEVNYTGAGTWNDLSNTNGSPQGYVIEFGDLSSGGNFTGVYSASTNVVLASVPGAPLSPSAVASAASAAVSWLSPSDNGGTALTGYAVTASPGGASCFSTTTRCVVTALTNGSSYTFTVVATNGVGPGIGVTSNAVVPMAPPNAPTGPTAVAGTTSATLSWSAPPDDGGSAVIRYTVTASPGGASCSSSTTTCVVNGLANGTTYTFTVVATNVVGSGPASIASNGVVPRTVPGAPSAVGASPGDGSSTVSWSAPSTDGGSVITGYTVTFSPGGATCATSTTTCTVTSLTNGTSYTVTVVATNAAGAGVAGPTTTVMPFGAPSPPLSVVATGGSRVASVTWIPPADTNGSPVTSYTVTAAPGGARCTTSGTTCLLGGLTNGTTYRFGVVATNGLLSASTTSNPVVPATVAAAPTDVTALGRPGAALVSWTAPTDDGGSAVIRYTVTASPGNAGCSISAMSCTVTGLTNGTSYAFTVVASNDAGSSAPSAPASATPITPTSIRLALPTSAIHAGSTVTVTASLSSPDVSGSVAFTLDGIGLSGCGNVAITAGVAQCEVRVGPAGTEQFGAAYPGSPTYGSSTATPLALDVTPAPQRTTIPQPGVDLVFGFTVGAKASGHRVLVVARGFAGSTATVTMHSVPVELGTAVIGPSGEFSERFQLPSIIPAGIHHIGVTGVGGDGSKIEKDWYFEVASDGTTLHESALPLSAPPPWSTPAPKQAVPQGRVIGGVRYAAYLPTSPAHAQESVDTEIAAFTLIGAIGLGAGLGATGGFSGRTEAEGAGREEREHGGDHRGGGGSLASAKVKHLKFRHEAEALGDRSPTWVSPFVDRLDTLSLAIPLRLNAVSPLAARLVNDGAYARAMFGSIWSFLPLTGLGLGLAAGASVHGAAVPPTLGLMAAVLVLSAFESLGGFLAALAYTAFVLVAGGIDSSGALRTVLGIDVSFFAGALAASAARPLRRVPPRAASEWFDRLADFVVGTLIGMWAISKMMGALSAISGVAFPIAAHANELAGTFGAAMLVRYMLETVAAHYYPLRLGLVAPPKIGFPKPRQQIVSALLKTAVYVFFAVAYLGGVWELYVGAALFLVPSLIAAYQMKLPNLPKLVRWLPAGVLKVVLMLVIGKAFGTYLAHHISSKAAFVELGFVLLGIPSLLLGLAGFVAHDGETFKLNWFFRLGGIAVVVLGVCVVEGVVKIA